MFLVISLISGRPTLAVIAPKEKPVLPISVGSDGHLTYAADARGDRVPDFSYCGYLAGAQSLPFVAVRVVVPAVAGDATNRIQSALDYVASLPLNPNGFRGAVLLGPGVHSVEGELVIRASGIVLRGSGIGTGIAKGNGGTVLLAAGRDRRNFITISGINDRSCSAELKIADPYVPVNAMQFHVSGSGFKSGDRVRIRRPSTVGWIKTLGCDHFGGGITALGWKPGERDLFWDRNITSVEGSLVKIDAPLTTALDSSFGGGTISLVKWPGRIDQAGIENMLIRSSWDTNNPKDEAHSWMAVVIQNALNIWVRQVDFEHFAGSAVAVYETARQVTVEDCRSFAPVSEIGGQRRNTFFTNGQQTLFLRCFAEYGYHDFAAGFCAAGPNAFVQCESKLPYSFSGTIDSWASGVLFDVVNVDGQTLSFVNRGMDGQGAGWSAANSVFWQCSAARVDCFRPPTANNWAFGIWAQFSGDGYWSDSNNHIRPVSLYFAQLSERLSQTENASIAEVQKIVTKPIGKTSGIKGNKKDPFPKGNHDRTNESPLKENPKRDMDIESQLLPVETEASSSPSVEVAAQLNAKSFQPPVQLRDWIGWAANRNPISIEVAAGVKTIDQIGIKKYLTPSAGPAMHLLNGWLVRGSGVFTGKKHSVPWWNTNPIPAVTRFVPGRTGKIYTDDLNEMTDWMQSQNIVSLEQNYGLWYDRRRDDHERIRRMDGDVWPPFYELPFARSGKETAWDGLSKYDLTKYNEWYWSRLKNFADLADQKGLVLVNQNYFQHNIIEAGAHWADFPWRAANNINNTGFPEPPPYAGDKRIFQAELFYDVNHPVRRPLHEAFIRKNQENFSENSGVIQYIGEEFTGPFHFVRFWLETVAKWRVETGKKAFIGLAVTKDVQDSVLNDPKLAEVVDLIDIRYWFPREDGSLYAPLGGQNLAPRQHARLVKPGKSSFEQVYRIVREYHSRFPGKAVTYSAEGYENFAWAVFMAGGSLAAIPKISVKGFLENASSMKVEIGKGAYKIANEKGECIVYCGKGANPEIDLTGFPGKFNLVRIDTSNGSETGKREAIKGGKPLNLLADPVKDVILWIRKE
ncbi:MAG: DUF6298 domain-containing protein [Prolixibacteraceae bacterium]